MKKFIVIGLVIVLTLAFSTMAIAKGKPNPPAPTGDTINACYKMVNGQLRLVNAPTDCRPSELPISWSTGAGPVTSALSGDVADIAGSASDWVFAGPTVSVTTTADQQITGVATATLGATGAAAFNYDLCYASGGPLTNFAGPSSPSGAVTTAQASFTAAGSVTPGAGTWDVGFCVLNSGADALDDNGVVNGWVIAE